MTAGAFYGTDLAFIHDAGFADTAEQAAPALIALLGRSGHESGLVVDAGCGSGVLSRPLLAAGYDVHGFDASPAMVRLARAAAKGMGPGRARFSAETLTDARLPACVAVFAVGEVVAYGGPRSLRGFLRFLRRAHEALAPGGVLAFDFLVPLPEGARRAVRRRERPGWSVVSETTELAADAIRRTITSVRRVGGRDRISREVHDVRIDEPDDVLSALAAAGFSARLAIGYGRYRLGPGHAVAFAKKKRRS